MAGNDAGLGLSPLYDDTLRFAAKVRDAALHDPCGIVMLPPGADPRHDDTCRAYAAQYAANTKKPVAVAPMAIKIGYRWFRITPLSEDAGVDDHGAFVPTKGIIEIASDDLPEEQGCTLIHELIHAALWLGGHHNANAKLGEEDICRRLDGPLATIFQTNPHLLSVIGDALTKGVPVVTKAAAE